MEGATPQIFSYFSVYSAIFSNHWLESEVTVVPLGKLQNMYYVW